MLGFHFREAFKVLFKEERDILNLIWNQKGKSETGLFLMLLFRVPVYVVFFHFEKKTAVKIMTI